LQIYKKLTQSFFLFLACLWQLSFTLVTNICTRKADAAADKAVAEMQKSAAFAEIPDVDKAYYLDSIRKIEARRYTDSISTEKIYFGYTFKSVQNQEINLGLDLKGGMNVMLQVQLEDLVKALAGNNSSPEFQKAIALAKERSVNSQLDFISLFADAWKEVAGGQRLAQIFGTYEMRDRIKPESSDDQVISVIRAESESAVANSFNVLRNRIDRFGVTQPSIQKLGNTGRILVELPGVKEPERVRKLLQGTASLEFWTTYASQEIAPYLEEANAVLAQTLSSEDDAVSETAGDESDDLVAQEIKAQGGESDNADIAAYKKANPLFAVLSPSQFRDNACIGLAAAADTALYDGIQITVYRVQYAERTAQEAIAYSTQTVKSDELFLGTTKVTQKGSNGSKTVVYSDKIVDGQLASSSVVSETVTKEAVPQIKTVGTKEKPAVTVAALKNGGAPISELTPPSSLTLENGVPTSYKRVVTGKAAAYSASAGAKTASGRTVKPGYIAVDPNQFPYGTELYIVSTDGIVYGYCIAADTGGFVKRGKFTVDLFMNSTAQCKQWGSRDVIIYVL